MSDFDFIDHYGDNEEVKGEEGVVIRPFVA